VAILEARAAFLASAGRRVWEPSPQMPALVIIIDEYAELAESAADAAGDADSIGRRGRAVAVTLIAATQRPTQKAMGQGALRSQMDVRICFRVRERKDVDLVLGQGMLTAGWQAHKLNAPGKFLISAPEHDTPRRARAYLLTDEAVSATASRHADLRPELDDVSRQALEDRADQHLSAPSQARGPADEDEDEDDRDDQEDAGRGPETLLWAALRHAPEQGVPVADLVAATGMSHRWVNYRLRALAATGQAVQIKRGIWRGANREGDAQ
jgi:S-DNA-T family DNA segregation ATPase FtsK/SpoIIIE